MPRREKAPLETGCKEIRHICMLALPDFVRTDPEACHFEAAIATG